MTFVADAFTDAANTALQSHTPDQGGPWVRHPNSAAFNLAITAGGTRARISNTGVSQIILYYLTGAPAGAEYDVQADFILVGTPTGEVSGITGRMSISATTMYLVRYDLANTRWQLAKIVSGTLTSLGTATQTLTANQTYVVKLQLRDAAKKVFVDGVEVITSADNAITAAGVSGFRVFTATTPSDSTSLQFDNFSATDAAVTVALAGTIAATSTLTGAATNKAVLAATIASTTSLTGAITSNATLAGTIAATSTLTGAATIAGVNALAGTIATTSTLTGALTTKDTLAGTITATAILTGNLTNSPPQTNALNGNITITSTLTGDLTSEEPLAPSVRYAIHWFWEPGNHSEQPDPPKTCPECGSVVILMSLDGEVITRHYELGATKPDGTIVEEDCPYIATINDSNYAQPLAADIAAGYVLTAPV